MDSEQAKIAEGVLLAVIGLLPGGSSAKELAKPLLGKLLSVSDPAPGAKVLKERAQEIADYFIALEQAGHTNKGSGFSASFDFLTIIDKTEITPRLLIDLELDRDRLWEYLQDVGKHELTDASQGRRARVLDGLKQFADAVLEVAPDLPAVRLEFMRAMLRRDNTRPK
jgi:hypothetical protein